MFSWGTLKIHAKKYINLRINGMDMKENVFINS